MHRGEDTSGEDASGEDASGEDASGEDTSGEDTSGEDTSGKVEHSSSGDGHHGDQGGPASGNKLIRVVEEPGTRDANATDVVGGTPQRRKHQRSQQWAVNASAPFTQRRGLPWVVGAYVALTKSLKDQCPPALNGAARDTGSPAL